MGKNKNKKNKSSNAVVTHSQSISYSGPLPTPVHLAQYEEILPGAAERILKMAEDQSSHRRSLESKVISSGVADSRKGLWFGFLIGLSGFAVVGYCAYLGFQILAGIIAALDLGSLVGVFVYGSRQRKIERVEKEKAV
ncbi:DUF2335 domain-containing protein [Patescibacteria group bacterium]|nr:DUF2335 domain-containing protein [Patescibacteria group bacterium]MBU1702978.1 DUF2335 domain-containing protein [Patescibacteria group bacterium]